jgi:hypothetical protein
MTTLLRFEEQTSCHPIHPRQFTTDFSVQPKIILKALRDSVGVLDEEKGRMLF